MQATAIEAEVQQYIQKHSNLHDQSGRRLVVRNGTLPTRRVHTCAGSIEVTQPRINDRPCLLVIVGSLPDGTKEVVGVLDGERESKLSWKDLLLSLKKRGLAKAPKLAVGDGALGFWSALEEVFPETRH